MKKILCFALAAITLMSVFSFSVSAVDYNEVSRKFYNYCLENVPQDMQPEGASDVEIRFANEIDGVTFFSARTWHRTEYKDVFAEFEEINIYSNQKYYPYELGIYAASGDEIYTLEEANNNGLIEDVSALKSSFDGWYTFYEDYVPKPENKYESYVVQKVFTPDEWTDELLIAYYSELFEYFADGVSSDDEAVPDYVLIGLSSAMSLNVPIGHILGDYVFYSMSGRYPFAYGYCVYVPETGEVHDLVTAYEMGIEGIEKVFTETKIGSLMGDMDKDRRLSIKDATYIQKALAGFDGYSFEGIYAAGFDETLPCAVSDFNRDRSVNIKDATAIQKHLAGLEY